MEMHATTAYWRDGKLFVYEGTQGVVNHRNVLANVFDLPPDRVEVHAPFIGSGFGSKLWPWPHSIAACAAAKVVKRPVQLMLPRAQMFTTAGHRPETLQRIRLATDGDGKLVSIRHESFNSTSTTDAYTEACGGVTRSLYSCANVLVNHKNSPLNRGTPTSMRAPGAAPGLFALESAIDELALLRGVDPLAFRKMNLATRDESLNLEWSSNHLPEAIDTAAERFGWQGRNAQVGSMRDGDELIGYGMGACNWEAYQVPTDARVIIRADGSALVQCGQQDIGTGTYTVVAQAVAQLTGLAFERIEVELGSSTFPPGALAGGSWATASILPAIAGATRAALTKLREYAVMSGGFSPGTMPNALASTLATSLLGTSGQVSPKYCAINASRAPRAPSRARPRVVIFLIARSARTLSRCAGIRASHACASLGWSAPSMWARWSTRWRRATRSKGRSSWGWAWRCSRPRRMTPTAGCRLTTTTPNTWCPCMPICPI